MYLFFIAVNYIRRHLKKFVLMIVSTAIIIASLLSIHIYKLATEYNVFLDMTQTTLDSAFIVFNVPKHKLNSDILESKSYGKQNIAGSIDINDETFYIANLDDIAISNAEAILLRGDYPVLENEIATDSAMLKTLNADIGDEISLPFFNGNTTLIRKFKVVGITDNFFNAYKNGDLHLISDEGFVPAYPRILVGEQSSYISHNISRHIIEAFYNNPMENGINLGQSAMAINYNSNFRESTDFEYGESLGLKIVFIQAFFIIIAMFAGVFINVKTLSISQEKNLKLMQIIGADKKQMGKIFIWQSLIISIFAIILSAGFAVAFMHFYNLLSSTNDSLFYLIPPYNSIIKTSVLAFILLMIFYVIYFSTITKSNEKSTRKKLDDEEISYEKLWHKTSSKQSLVSSIAYGFLNTAFVVIFTFGIYFGDTVATTYVWELEQGKQATTDYSISVQSGSKIIEVFELDTPTGRGLSSDFLSEITTEYPLKIEFKAMKESITARLVNNSAQSQPSYYKNLHSIPIPNELAEAMKTAGFSANDNLIPYSIVGVPYENLNEIIGDNAFSKDDYNSGKIVIAMNSGFSIGDKIKVAFLFYPNDINQNNYTQIVPQTIFSNLIISDKMSHSSTENNRKIKGECIIVSNEYLLSLDNKFKYDVVEMNNAKSINEKVAKQIDFELTKASNQGNVSFENLAMINILKKNLAKQYKMPFLIVSFLYLMITIMFSYTTINSEIKAKQRQISILKAIGMSRLQLEKMLAFTAIKRTVLGLFIGSILSVCLCLAFSFSAFPVELLLLLPYWDIAIGVICVFILVILASTLSAKSAVKSFKTNGYFNDN